MSAVTTTAQLFVKSPQFVVETTEGTTPTSSPTFTALGAVKSISLKINGNFVDISQIASEDLITILQGMQEYETQFTMTVVNSSSIIQRLVNSANPGTPSGTVSETMSILWSFYLNNSETYVICKGSRIKEGSLTMEVGKETEVSVTFIHTTITTPGAHGLTTPSFASVPTGDVWGWLDGGATPMSWNSTGQLCKKITINVNRGSKSDHILGQADPHSSQPHGRRITGDFTVLHTSTTLETDFRTPTARTLAVVLKSSVSTITLSGTKIVDYTRDVGSDDEDATIEACTFRALTAAVT